MTQVTHRQETLDQTVARLETFLARMERRYECPSESLADALRNGSIRETAEISRWLTSYRTLRRLRELSGQEAR